MNRTAESSMRLDTRSTARRSKSVARIARHESIARTIHEPCGVAGGESSGRIDVDGASVTTSTAVVASSNAAIEDVAARPNGFVAVATDQATSLPEIKRGRSLGTTSRSALFGDSSTPVASTRPSTTRGSTRTRGAA